VNDNTIPAINVSCTPSVSVTFELCLFEDISGIVIELNRSYFNSK
jgi:hypothetical protein